MSDQFRIIGDEIHFGPWHVADFRKEIPATVRERCNAIENYELNEEASYSKGYEEAEKDQLEIIKELEGEIEDLKHDNRNLLEIIQRLEMDRDANELLK